MGLGLGAIFTAYPTLYTVLKYVGAAYLLYLAWAIAMSGGIDDKGEKRGRPMSFLGGAVFQWVNVKGLIMSVGAVTTYSAIAPYPYNIIALSLIFTRDQASFRRRAGRCSGPACAACCRPRARSASST